MSLILLSSHISQTGSLPIILFKNYYYAGFCLERIIIVICCTIIYHHIILSSLFIQILYAGVSLDYNMICLLARLVIDELLQLSESDYNNYYKYYSIL